METLDLKVEEALKEFIRRNRRLGLVGYSSRLRDGKVVIYVSSAEKVSKLTLPRVLSGLDIEFQVVGLMKALEGPRGGDEDRTGYFDPLPAGVSIGHYRITAGSTAWFAVKDGKTLIISNNHVLAWENKGQVGDPVLQPGPYDISQHGWDASDPKYVAGRLLWFVPVVFEEYTCPYRNFVYRIGKALGMVKAAANRVDLAVAEATRPVELSILGLDSVKGWAMVSAGAAVRKSGRTTGVTYGYVVDTRYNGYVNYSRGVAWFENQLLIKSAGGQPFSQGGDSGSLVVTESGAFAGLLFAGSSEYTLANPAQYVLEYLREEGIKMVGVDA